MQKDQMRIKDKMTISKQEVGDLNEVLSGKKDFKVISEAGLFKNGKQYNQGDLVSLDEKTATNFVASGDIKPI